MVRTIRPIAVRSRGEVWGRVLCRCPMPDARCPMPDAPREHLMLLRKAIPHFDFVGSGTDDISSLPILAFQQLWNLNHPEEKIPEDGQYTPETEERLNQSPREGFPKGGRAVN